MTMHCLAWFFPDQPLPEAQGHPHVTVEQPDQPPCAHLCLCAVQVCDRVCVRCVTLGDMQDTGAGRVLEDENGNRWGLRRQIGVKRLLFTKKCGLGFAFNFAPHVFVMLLKQVEDIADKQNAEPRC